MTRHGLSAGLLLLGLVSWFSAVGGQAQRQPHIAIVGGGVSGAAAAYYLRQQLGPEASITVFERGDALGGRTHSVEVEGLTVELGASIVWGRNYLIRDLASSAGLEREEPSNTAGLFAVYDGRELVFAESPWRLLTLLRLLWRYWLGWFSFRSQPAAVFAKFEGIYALLDNGTTFDRPADLLKAVGLYGLTQASMFEWLRETYGTSLDLLGSELIGGINRVNYDQSNRQLNALAGMVSMLPATEPAGVFHLRGGNCQLAPRLLQLANATSAVGAEVSSLQLLPGGGYSLELAPPLSSSAAVHGPVGEVRRSDATAIGAQESAAAVAAKVLAAADRKEAVEEAATEAAAGAAAAGAAAGAAGAGGGGGSSLYDAVIVATPLESSGLSFKGFDMPVIPARKYQQTVTTIVKGLVRPSFFGLSEMTYSQVMVSDGAGVPWSSLSCLAQFNTTVGRRTVTLGLWKLFSPGPMPHAWLEMMFEAGFEVVVSKAWSTPGAYPAFDPPEDFAPFKLAPGLFYASALENAASAMEIAAIQGRMAALLAAQHLAAQQAQQAQHLAEGGGAPRAGGGGSSSQVQQHGGSGGGSGGSVGGVLERGGQAEGQAEGVGGGTPGSSVQQSDVAAAA